ncbi:MAG: C-GCAxxG-C-C family protein [Verrucomicrobia bacterium]|nr:C-GCAxxG-C-C family protein [Verrucomicrobiota bacterium]
MKGNVGRRQFVRTAVASAGAWVCAGAGVAPAMAGEAAGAGRPAASKPVPLAESLSREDLIEAMSAIAESNMRQCHHCAQASFLTLQEVFGLEGGAIVKALTPLPGIAERGETCGAVIGSLMALGLVFGRDRVDDWAAWRACLAPAREFCARFVREQGSTQCGDLLEKHFGRRFDLGDPGDLARFQSASPGPTEVCGRVVTEAVRMAAEVILEGRRRPGRRVELKRGGAGQPGG